MNFNMDLCMFRGNNWPHKELLTWAEHLDCKIITVFTQKNSFTMFLVNYKEIQKFRIWARLDVFDTNDVHVWTTKFGVWPHMLLNSNIFISTSTCVIF